MSTATSGFTKEMARNIFYGGSLFFILVFVGLVFHSERVIPARSNQQALTESVVRGKAVWEQNNCIGCHTLLGEGAYFAPELATSGSAAAARPRAAPSSRRGCNRSRPARPAVARCPSST